MNTADEIKNFTASKINRLLSDPSESAVRASMARLRRGIGHVPGELPELWGEYLLDIPEQLTGNGEPSAAEWSIYTALTTFAMHQQGCDRKSEPMHRPGNSLGAAARNLLETEEDRERIARRFYPVATASGMTALSRHLRDLVSLLRAKKIPLDYVRLAADLYYMQNSATAEKVRLRWGEDFFKLGSKENNNINENEKG